MSLGQACKGLALMSTQLDRLGHSLFDGKVGGGMSVGGMSVLAACLLCSVTCLTTSSQGSWLQGGCKTSPGSRCLH